MNKTGINYLDYCWNPMGAGCSNSANCPTCWARKQAMTPGPRQPKCSDCRAFKVHFHPERLERRLSPAHVKKPAVVGVEFMGDLFDRVRLPAETRSCLEVCYHTPQHTYVFLTREYGIFRARTLGVAPLPNWHIGTTCQRQSDFDRAAQAVGESGWNWWVSAEPLSGPIIPGAHRPEGIIIGCDNDIEVHWDERRLRYTADAFREAGVKVYVKQMWVTRGKLTRRATLPEEMPEGLRSRELPWTLTTKKP
jgi:protein gp37